MNIFTPASRLLSGALRACRSIENARRETLWPFLERRHSAIILAIAAFYLVTASLRFKDLPFNLWIAVAAAFAVSAGAYISIQRGFVKTNFSIGIVVFASYAACSLLIFHGSLGNVFRDDYWLILSLFNSIDKFDYEAFKKISFFEMAGDARFQPLAHLIIYARHLAFGDNVVLYNLLNVFLHALTAFAVYSVVKEAREDTCLAFLSGAIFLALATHFDTIRWTYHIYIIIGVLAILLAALLAFRYEASSGITLIAAFFLTFLSLLLYEAAVFAPLFLMFLVPAVMLGKGRSITVKDLRLPVLLMASVYAVYAAVTIYGFSIKEANPTMSPLSAISSLNAFKDAAKALLTNLLQTSFMKNAGVIKIEPHDTVSLPTLTFPAALYYTAQLLIGGLLLSLMSLNGKKKYPAAILALLAVSYIYVIYLGRSITDNIDYMVSQSRYQYFSNAIFAVCAALLLGKNFGKKNLKPIIIALIAVVFLWNAETVIVFGAQSPTGGVEGYLTF